MACSKPYIRVHQDHPLIVGQIVHGYHDLTFNQWRYPVSNKELAHGYPPHPATFIPSSLIRKFPYETSFRLAGDYWLWRTLLTNRYNQIVFIKSPITFFMLGGLSTQPCNSADISLETGRDKSLSPISVLIISTLRDIKIFLLLFLGKKIYFRTLYFKHIIGKVLRYFWFYFPDNRTDLKWEIINAGESDSND